MLKPTMLTWQNEDTDGKKERHFFLIFHQTEDDENKRHATNVLNIKLGK